MSSNHVILSSLRTDNQLQEPYGRHFHCQRFSWWVRLNQPSSSHFPNSFFFLSSLRSIVRNLLATGPPGLASAFTNAARSRLRQTNSKIHNSPYLFQRQTRDKPSAPMPSLHDLLTRARSLYGAGLGFASLGLLSAIVRATIGLRWEDDGDMADILAVIDADIGQAIQASLCLTHYIQYSTLSVYFPEFKRRNRRGWRHWLYVGTRSQEWFTMCCKRQSCWCQFLGRRISVWEGSCEYWILEILIIRRFSSSYLSYAIYNCYVSICCITVISRYKKKTVIYLSRTLGKKKKKRR